MPRTKQSVDLPNYFCVYPATAQIFEFVASDRSVSSSISGYKKPGMSQIRFWKYLHCLLILVFGRRKLRLLFVVLASFESDGGGYRRRNSGKGSEQ
jgi:hypothetical protein